MTKKNKIYLVYGKEDCSFNNETVCENEEVALNAAGVCLNIDIAELAVKTYD